MRTDSQEWEERKRHLQQALLNKALNSLRTSCDTKPDCEFVNSDSAPSTRWQVRQTGSITQTRLDAFSWH